MTDILDRISGDEALRILTNLCATDKQLRARILTEAQKVLREVVLDDVAAEVFFDLDRLDVDELWDRSGPKRDGYSSPDEMAVEMVEETLKPYQDKIMQYLEMGMPEQAKQYCMGVLKGIHQFDQESHTEFKQHAPDVAGECFGWILEEWRKRGSQEDDIREMNAFISRECPDWADEIETD